MMSKKSEVSKKPEVSRKPLELMIKITVDRKDPDALVRLLIKQQKELLSADIWSIRSAFPHGVAEKDGVLIICSERARLVVVADALAA